MSFLLEKELQSIIARGENLTVEFKSWVKTSSHKERVSLAVK